LKCVATMKVFTFSSLVSVWKEIHMA